ncbi:MAG: LysM peptidoglycan-binding domain-containing protein, partial [Dokdonella sp.]
ARKNGNCNLATLGVANGLRAPHYSLKPGQTLKLTGC